MYKLPTKLFFLALLLSTISYAQVGIGTTSPAATADITALNATGASTNVDGLLIPRVNRQRARLMTSITTSTLIYVNALNSTQTGQAANIDTVGFYYFDGTVWQKLNPAQTNDWSLTGNANTNPLTNFIGTTDAKDLRFKTGNQDRLNISNSNGQLQSYYAGAVGTPAYSWNGDPNTGMYQGGADVLGFSTNGVERVIMNNTATVVNDASNNYDFRVETDGNQYGLFSDASQNAVMFGSTGTLYDDGTSYTTYNTAYTTNIDYVADFDNAATRGTTIGLGSIEYLVDGEAELFISDSFSPVADITFDLGLENAWRDVYAENYYTTSDITAKNNIEPMKYGLNEIMKLNTISYTLKRDPNQEKKIGLVAQEVNQYIPEAAKTETTKKNEKGQFETVQLKHMKVSYVNLVPVLIKAVQEQQATIDALEKRLSALESKK